MQRYKRREGTRVIAIRLDLDTPGLTYQKWGKQQRANRGDWLVQSRDDVYTVAAETFGRTYRQVGPGQYEKATDVWVRRADEPGVIPTLEGATTYEAGDYLVFNDEAGTDGYAMARSKFEELYEIVE